MSTVAGFPPLLVDEVMAFLVKHAFKTAEFGGIRRKDVYSIPIEPLREIIINAVVHATYAGAHSPIRVAFMDALSLTDQYTNAARHIKPLIEAGLVEMTEPLKPRAMTQRYRITEAGLTWLANHKV